LFGASRWLVGRRFRADREASHFAVYPDGRQTPSRPVDASYAEYGGTVLLPTTECWMKPYSSLFRYPWEPT
jgi:gentisate 1,2-dioxygenase